MSWIWVDNPDWDLAYDQLMASLEGWEWPEPPTPDELGLCNYCCERPSTDIEPFGNRKCCRPCFLLLVESAN